ncbi:hypothetical protein GAGA_1921 [Paraglaciecola agarilytica NO2]|uniref:Uncharacterized protein n=1 Tax=Paraglaciecola agarilytica NO2 TaxID=1125747 RepID=A0ABQ0I623_9ALTE|nr:hypothetical protein GAGA_1921 [Paraglaciecola agarilytica NO2]
MRFALYLSESSLNKQVNVDLASRYLFFNTQPQTLFIATRKCTLKKYSKEVTLIQKENL